ncbi:hypothetical protein AAG906_006818 [Vitis piasezkii]
MPTTTCLQLIISHNHPLLQKLTVALGSKFLAIPRPAATKKKKRPPSLTHFSYGTHQRRHTDPSASREARLSASAPQDPSQASRVLTVPSSRVGAF